MDDFKFEQLIGKGNQGKVFLTKGREDGQCYAVKVISDRKSKLNRRQLWNLTQEILSLRMLNNDYFVRLYRIYEGKSHLYLILEYLGQETLSQVIQTSQSFNEIEIKAFCQNFLKALQYLHNIQIIHRDIKPSNVLLLEHQTIARFKIIDFGFSEILTERSRIICGTPGYTAPEVLNRQLYDFKADVFSLGVIIYRLYTKQFPFLGNTTQEILKQNRQCQINFDSIQNVSPQGLDILKQMLDQDQYQRPTVSQLLNHSWFQNKNPLFKSIRSLRQLRLSDGASTQSSEQGKPCRTRPAQLNLNIIKRHPETLVTQSAAFLMQKIHIAPCSTPTTNNKTLKIITERFYPRSQGGSCQFASSLNISAREGNT